MESTAAAQNLATLQGGREMSVTYRDGKTETVKVLQLPIEKYPELLKLWMGDEQAQLDLYCDKTPGWSKALTIESHHALVECAQEINRSFFEPWVQRRMAKIEMVKPGMFDKILGGAEPSTSPNSSPKLRPMPVSAVLQR